MKKTKIICTIGPASESPEIMGKMIKAGMNVARLNFSHGNYEEHGKRIETIRSLSAKLNTTVAILLDTKGPEIRCGKFNPNPKPLEKESADKYYIVKGQSFTFYNEDKMGGQNGCSVSYKNLYQDVKPGNRILINDGLIAFGVKAINGKDIECIAENSGLIGNNKNGNVPGVATNIPFLQDKDKEDIAFAAKNNMDFIAASFTREAADILEIRKILEQHDNPHIGIIAKIENHQGMDNFDEILREADGIMVARGDLGVEIPFDEVPLAKRDMIKRCLKAGKIVITATQMLETMTKNPRPTRAEANDVSDAVWQGTTAVMLSGETAGGDYPVESVETMASIAIKTESSIDYWKRFYINKEHITTRKTGTAIGQAACDVASSLNAKAILVLTKSGYTAAAVAQFRPACPIIAHTTNDQVQRQLALGWGLIPLKGELKSNLKEMLEDAIKHAVEAKLITDGDMVILTGGLPSGEQGNTSFLKAHTVGNTVL